MINIQWINILDKSVLKRLELFTKALTQFLHVQNISLGKELSLSVSLSTDEEIIDLNSEYRDKDKITDVLSFALYEDFRNSFQELNYLEEIEVGDIFICESVCISQAKEFGLNFDEEFFHLVTHGFLHLLGFDHEISDEEEKLMETHEAYILGIFKNLTN